MGVYASGMGGSLSKLDAIAALCVNSVAFNIKSARSCVLHLLCARYGRGLTVGKAKGNWKVVWEFCEHP